MSNFYGKTRTNYFCVTDENALRDIISRACGSEDTVHLHVEQTISGEKKFMFLCGSEILGFPETDESGEVYEDCDYSFDEFTAALQKILPENEAIIITEVGNEKMRYLLGCVTVVTRNEIKYENLRSLGINIARELLKDESWDTKNEY